MQELKTRPTKQNSAAENGEADAKKRKTRRISYKPFLVLHTMSRATAGRRPLSVHFIEVHYTHPIDLPQDLIEALPERLILFTTVQYHSQLAAWRAVLEAAGKKVFTFRPKHSAHEGQLLGCGIEDWSGTVDAEAFLFIGDGVFHPKALTIHNELPVYCYDPKREQWLVLKDEDIARAKQRHRAALSQFLMARKVGV
ncbi:hypothetical protein D6789_00760, partial [Candidatus Woesearchaeota archaeon]